MFVMGDHRLRLWLHKILVSDRIRHNLIPIRELTKFLTVFQYFDLIAIDLSQLYPSNIIEMCYTILGNYIHILAPFACCKLHSTMKCPPVCKDNHCDTCTCQLYQIILDQ